MNLVQNFHPQTDDVERVQHRDGVGLFVADRVDIAVEWTQRCVLNALREQFRRRAQPRSVSGA